MHFHHSLPTWREGAGITRKNNYLPVYETSSSSMLGVTRYFSSHPYHFPNLEPGRFACKELGYTSDPIAVILRLSVPIGQGQMSALLALCHPFLPCIKCRNVLIRLAYWRRWWRWQWWTGLPGSKEVTIDLGSWRRQWGGEGTLGLWLEHFHLGHLLAE